MKYGYIRDSMNNPESIRRQQDELEACGVGSLITEESGQALGTQFKALFGMLKPGDALVVTHLSRITRDKADMLKLADYLIENNITLCEKETPVNLPTLKKILY